MAVASPVPYIYPMQEALLEELCIAFLQSKQYLKAMKDARYERIQAIADFLTQHTAGNVGAIPPEQLAETALYIRKNYYRFF